MPTLCTDAQLTALQSIYIAFQGCLGTELPKELCMGKISCWSEIFLEHIAGGETSLPGDTDSL